MANYVATIREVDAILDPATCRSAKRKRLFTVLEGELLKDQDPICQQMGRMMASFKPGLFAGAVGGIGRVTNWIWSVGFVCRRAMAANPGRLPCGSGNRARLARSDAGLGRPGHHPQPFTEKELRPYRDAKVPSSQKEVIHRRKAMRAAGPTKKRGGLLRKLEERYESSFPH